MERRLKWNVGTKKTLFKVIWLDNCTEPIRLIDTEKPISRVTKELVVGMEEVKEFNKQQTLLQHLYLTPKMMVRQKI